MSFSFAVKLMGNMSRAGSEPSDPRSPPRARVTSTIVEFTFVSSIYLLECGHSLGVRSNRTSAPGTTQSCTECASDQVVVDIVTLGE
jgi:hypothetical protein